MKSAGRPVVVASTHLKAKEGAALEAVRVRQVRGKGGIVPWNHAGL